MSNRYAPEPVIDESQLTAKAPGSCEDSAIAYGVGEILRSLGSDHKHNMTLILKYALEKVNGQFAVYRQFDSDRQEIYTRQEESSNTGFELSGGLSCRICHEAFVSEKQSSLLINDLSQSAYWDADPDYKRYQLRSYIGCPVLVSGSTIGSLALFDQQPDRFCAHHVTLLILLADIIAFVERHRQVEKDQADRLRREKMLSEICISAVSDLEVEKFIARCAGLIGKTMAADGVSLFRQNEELLTFKGSTHWCVDAESSKDMQQHFGDLLSLPVAVESVKEGTLFHCTDRDAISNPDLGNILKACAIKALILIPLVNENRFIGCFAIYRTDKAQPWCEEDIAKLAALMKVLEKKLDSRSVARRLDESEALNHQLFQLSPAAIYRIDFKKPSLVAVNDRLCDASGYTREELLSMNPIEILTPRGLELYLERQQAIAAGEPVSEVAEFEVQTKDGTVEWGRFHIRHLYEDDQIVGANVVAVFNTEQRRSRVALNDYRKNLESMVTARVADLAKANQALRDEIDQRVQATEKLQASSESLKEMNTAMRVMLDKRMEDHQRTEELIRLNLKELIDPYLTRLENGELRGSQRQLVDLIRVNLDEVVASSMPEFASKYYVFSPNELQVVNLIRKGKTTKEMARLLNLSTRTVESYRNSIRKKLKIKNKKVNLRTYLSSI